MKINYIVIVLFAFLSSNFANDVITLKSGRMMYGNAIEEGDFIKVVDKYGTITFRKSDVVVTKGQRESTIHEVKENAEEVPSSHSNKLVKTELITKSGRKIIGNVYEKEDGLYLIEEDGVVKLNPATIFSRTDFGQNKIKGEILVGENCIINLKSGRSFSGIIEEIDDTYYITSPLGTVKIEKKNVENIYQTGVELNLLEERKKASGGSEVVVMPIASSVTETKENTKIDVFNKNQNTNATVKKELDPNHITADDIQSINKRIEETLKEANSKTKVIKTIYETY